MPQRRGQVAADPATVTVRMAGSGVQTGTASRWGDYAMMAIDPTDDCTFWMTTEYMATTSGPRCVNSTALANRRSASSWRS